MGGASIWHWIVVGLLVMVFFGRGKLSEIMGDAAKGIKAFKKGMAEEEAPAAAKPVTPPAEQPARPIEHRPDPVATSSTQTFADRKVG